VMVRPNIFLEDVRSLCHVASSRAGGKRAHSRAHESERVWAAAETSSLAEGSERWLTSRCTRRPPVKTYAVASERETFELDAPEGAHIQFDLNGQAIWVSANRAGWLHLARVCAEMAPALAEQARLSLSSYVRLER
jgi:hypothetical protein